MESIKTVPPLMPGYATTLHTGRMRRTFLRLALIFVGIGVGLSLSEVAMRAFQIGHKNTVTRYNEQVWGTLMTRATRWPLTNCTIISSLTTEQYSIGHHGKPNGS